MSNGLPDQREPLLSSNSAKDHAFSGLWSSARHVFKGRGIFSPFTNTTPWLQRWRCERTEEGPESQRDRKTHTRV